MSLTPPPLARVNPGDPIASQQWNFIVDGIKALYDAYNKSLGTLDATVKDKATGNPIPSALVSVIPGQGTPATPRVAPFVGGSVNRYHLDQLAAGAYTVVVQAIGFGDETRAVTIDDAGAPITLTVEMTAALIAVPVLYGKTLTDAIIQIGTDLQVVRIIDSHGNDIPPGALTDAAKQGLVLNQLPPPGAVVPKTSGLALIISAKAEYAEKVKVPDLRGLTIDQARTALQTVHLVLGDTTNA
jgi:hypothetical protein